MTSKIRQDHYQNNKKGIAQSIRPYSQDKMFWIDQLQVDKSNQMNRHGDFLENHHSTNWIAKGGFGLDEVSKGINKGMCYINNLEGSKIQTLITWKRMKISKNKEASTWI